MLVDVKTNVINQINPQDIIRAFQTLANPTNSQQSIKFADKYLSQCETNPQFSRTLISIFAQLPNNITKNQVLIHLKNVIKRNWTIKRRSNQTSIMTQQIKQKIKSQLLQIYKQNWKLYYKQFNQIFKYLSRQDFPLNYKALNQFVRQVLTDLARLGLEQIIGADQLLPYLSLVKVVYKQYAQRRMLHSIQAFQKYCNDNIDTAVNILQKLGEALTIVQSNPQIQIKSAQKVLQCSRKIDKIVLYCLQSIVSPLQFNTKIRQIVKFQLTKVQLLLSISNPNLKKQVQLNILAIIQLTSKLQSFYPFIFTQFLSSYLQLILGLLFTQNFQIQKLICSLVQSSSRTISCFSYFMQSNQYKLSIEYKKQNQNIMIENSQKSCHDVYLQVYNSSNVSMMLEKIVGQLMVRFPRESQQDQILFQDGGQQGIQQGVYQMLLDLVRVIFKRFVNDGKIFINKVITQLLNINNDKSISRIHNNMYQVVLQVPKVFQQIEIPIQTIFKLMQKCYYSQNYDMFCRLLRIYMQHVSSQIPNFFTLLIQIILSNNPKPHTIYQAAACIRKILVDYQQLPLPLQQIGPCLTQILNLISIYKTIPTHLWNLLNLLVQILKALNIETVLFNLKYLNNCIDILVQNGDNDNLILCALCDLMQSLLTLMDSQDNTYLQDKMRLYQIALRLVCTQSVKQEQEITQMSKQCLWLCVVKNINSKYCPEQLKSLLLNMIATGKQPLISSDPSLFFQLLEQYLLSQILQINSTDLHKLYSQLVDQIQPESDIRTLITFFSLCYSYILLTNDNNQQLLLLAMKKIKQLQGKITPSINGLRMILMLIVCTGILTLGAQKVFQLFNDGFGDYRIWFMAYLDSLEYTNNKYSAKINTITILHTLPILKGILLSQIDNNLPIDYILKFITYYVQPIPYQQSLSNYTSSIKQFSHIQQIKLKNKSQNLPKNISRKVKLHINANYTQLDLKKLYKQRIGELMVLWDWGVDDLQERYTENLVEKIIVLLNNQ